ncbi:subtilisin-like protease SBT1.5 [Telopea speciosissima]|uniref:subtilisin-like protease SBT1.5 n=1 Tax=Telopea speciosissima TaxID=54955 RepID=UPI001CC5A662|nr:subtilisin-like protease SBT1.5 [Telopea speciosissima]XP_043720479.1 subtilisin-like protease SBT1.5 [Telopea speciosissima]XP_043720480.1 subtilisin-like protease SBT1.5 [Telopea speciosissima]XP_043720482.1 subtilisin-like protease SBT1.5 [Telopea speciosissima]
MAHSLAVTPPYSLLLSMTLTFFFFFFFTSVCFSVSDAVKPKTFIVRVQHDAKPSVFSTHKHWYESSLKSISSQISPDDTTTSVASDVGSRIIHTYQTVFHGFSAKLSPSEAQRLQDVTGVLAVIPEQVRHLQTTRSPQFLGLKTGDSSGLLKESDFGSDLVIGVIDTGIWPERKSFNDRDLGPVPNKWKGECVVSKDFTATSCNRKLIGARFFCSGYEATNGKMNETTEYRSPRDSDGHGTHTASIAAGRYVFPASTLGYASGIAAGMAPKARLAAYKVCWTAGCYDSDILAAFDAAVSDGVDVVSLSVGGVVVPYYLDSIAIGAFGAADHGVFVSASAGNGGPGGLTVTNVAPWVTTVGAGSIDRDFPADVKLGDGRVVSGVSVYSGPGLATDTLYPLIYAGTEGGDGYSASLCLEGSLDPNVVRGKIVLCDRGINSRAAKGEVVKKAGGVGMILANGVFDGEGLVADCHVLPATAVGASGGDEIRKYISAANSGNKNGRATSTATATITFRGTRLGTSPAPVVASFSARGPNPESPEILKPDVIAPGLNILAAWPEGIGPSGLPSDKRNTEFNILSGTSMACPHVSGLAALLKAAHPEWSPAAIRSALMTTAYVIDSRGGTMLDESSGNSSTVMDYGAGHVDPQKAMDPGLVYDISTYDYVDFLCNSNYSEKNIQAVTRKNADCRGARQAGHVGNLNYPSLTAVFQEEQGRRKMSTHFIRTVTNVGEPKSVYQVTVKPPSGTTVTVQPEKLVFRRVGQKLSFLVRVKAIAVKLSPGSSTMTSGSLAWSDGKRVVTNPIVITMQQPL